MKSARLTLGIAAVSLAGALGASPAGDDLPPPARSLAVADMDPKAEACTDFYQYADGGWLEKNPIPSDRPRWGTFDELRQRNLDRPAQDPREARGRQLAPAGSDERKLGDFYGACMDEAAIEAHGPQADRAGARPDRRDPEPAGAARRRSPASRRMGVDVLFEFGSEEDRKNSSKVIAAALQGGLGLPDRDYYRRPTRSRQELRGEVRRARREDARARRRDAGEARPPTRRRSWTLETKLAAGVDEQGRHPRPGQDLPPDDASRPSRRTNAELRVGRVLPRQKLAGRHVSVNVWQPDFFEADRQAPEVGAARRRGRRTCAGACSPRPRRR